MVRESSTYEKRKFNALQILGKKTHNVSRCYGLTFEDFFSAHDIKLLKMLQQEAHIYFNI